MPESMVKINPAIEPTDDGSQTLRHPIVGDTYHSTRGARGEAEHIFIVNGFEWWLERNPEAGSVNILEAGFGSGLNACLTGRAARMRDVEVYYLGVELYPVDVETINLLDCADEEYLGLHEAEWGVEEKLCDHFTLRKEEIDLLQMELEKERFDLVYYDAFAPESQPELWTAEIFGKIYEAMRDGGVLVTYSAKGTVKEALRSVGFEVTRPEGALGKRHMVRAIK